MRVQYMSVQDVCDPKYALLASELCVSQCGGLNIAEPILWQGLV